jgi:glycosyltransferase involved in cell wall biosynthesis
MVAYRRGSISHILWLYFEPVITISPERYFSLEDALCKVAVCLPAFNERDNLEVLLPELERALISLALPMPLVVVFDDGSTDGTFSWLRGCEFSGFEFIVMRSMARVGKASALNHAITKALELGASSVFMMDADGQDDPANVAPMLEELNRGAEVVNARRVNRNHNFAKRYSSRLFNGIVRLITGVKAQDINSGMKAFNREAAEVIVRYFYGELHRVILIVAIRVGLEMGETKVHNRARLSGSSKYGAARGWRGLFDLLTLQFLQRYHARPGHFFSGAGALFLFGGLTTVLVGLLTRPGDLFDAGFGLLPWVGLGGMGMGMGVILISFGFVTELMLFISKNPTTAVVRVHETPRK